jgi:hypothetical protein
MKYVLRHPRLLSSTTFIQEDPVTFACPLVVNKSIFEFDHKYTFRS